MKPVERTRPSPPGELTDVAGRVQAALSTLFDDELERWRTVDDRLAEVVAELADHVLRGGKRLRAAFCYWAAVGAGGGEEPPGVWQAACAFELLQGFALIHDDVMDDADTRRGHPTVHVSHADRLRDAGWRGEPRRYGEGVAILVGDLGHVYADRCTSDLPPAARRIWDELRIELNLGQYLDLRAAAAAEVDGETAARVSLFKSGLYTIVRPLQLGAALSPHVTADLLEGLDAYGRPLGRAFQLRDDLLGVLGDANTVGKPVGDDLREGKPTELLVAASERAEGRQRRLLERVGQPDLTTEELIELVQVLHATGAVAAIEERIETLVSDAVRAVNLLGFEPGPSRALVALAHYVAGRDH
jgi:geranylgeranyl diphosphate synthase, type I